MHFADGINRPPYETANGYLQTTQGCSHNHCLFCTYFKDRAFRKSPIEEIEADIKEMPRHFGAPKRIFLQGADGFAADYANPYIGVESGDDVVLKRIGKGYTAAQARAVLEKIDASGLPYVVNFLNGVTNDTIFMNEHASNLFHVRCRIPEEKEALLAYIRKFADGSDEKDLRRYREMITSAF